MISKEIIIQYCDLQEEIKETRERKDKLCDQITKLEKDIQKIEEEGTVKDKVRGGLGGIQNFNIEGFPSAEYDKKRTQLLQKRILFNQRKSTLDVLEFTLLETLNEVQEYINSIEDSRMRRIVSMRVVDSLSWNKVADRMGGGNTEDSVKKAFYRFMDEK